MTDGYKIHYDSAAVDAALARLAGAAEDMTPAFRDMGEFLVETTKARFRAGEAPDGSPWAPKSPATIAAYLARGDGNLPDPLIGPSKRLGSEIHYRATKGGVTVGSSLVYALVQQLGAAKGAFGSTSRGAPIPWGDIPARPFIGLSKGDETGIVEILTEHFSTAGGG